MDEQPVITRRRLPQAPAEVWRTLTSADGFAEWMGPGSTIDPVPGGRLIAADIDSGVPKVGQVLEADPIERLRWAWRPLGDSASTRESEFDTGSQPDGEAMTGSEVEIELAPAEESGTEITVTEHRSTVHIPWAGGAQACAVSVR